MSIEPPWIELRATPFFRRLTDEELVAVERLILPVEFAPGQVIHPSGARLDWLYVLVEGKVALTDAPGLAHCRVLDILAPGECFPVEAFLHSQQSCLHACALSAVKALAIDMHGLQFVMARNPLAGRELYAAAAESLGALLGRVLRSTAQRHKGGRCRLRGGGGAG